VHCQSGTTFHTVSAII